MQEDCVLPPATVSPARFGSQLDDLAAAVDLLSAFDRMHDVRALLATGFVERFGAGRQVPLAEHADALIDDLLRRTTPQEASGLPAGPRDGSLARLHVLRRTVWDALHADLDRSDRTGDDLRWSRSDATAAVADLPERFRRDPLLYGALVQPAGDRLVLNDAYAGHGMLFGRFLGPDHALGGDAADRLSARLEAVYGADGARVVEDLGLHRLNVNARPPVLRDRLRPEDWQRLRLVHDAATDTLVIRDDDDRDVRVLHLGAGHPDLLPGPLRLAIWLVCGGRLMEDVVGGWHDATGWDGRRTRRCPRISVGQAVLARRRWYGGEELDRLIATGAGPAELLVALTAWRVRHGVPEEVVLTDSPEYDYGPPGGKDEADDRARRRKPQHLDLASALAARVLPRSADRRRAGHLEEALPGVAAGGHAREWVVEVGRAGGGGAFGWGGAW